MSRGSPSETSPTDQAIKLSIHLLFLIKDRIIAEFNIDLNPFNAGTQ